MNYQKKDTINENRYVLYMIMGLIGLILIPWQILIYKRTIVSLYVILSIIVGVGLLGFLIDGKNYINTYKLKGWKAYFYAIIQNVFSWGIIITSILILSNYYTARGEIKIQEYKIVERSSLPITKGRRGKESKRRTPVFHIIQDGEERELSFSSRYHADLFEYNSIRISTREGFLWEVEIGKTLLNRNPTGF